MVKKTEYLITKYTSDFRIIKQLRAPKCANLHLLLERLICKDLDDETVVNSCLRSNAKRFIDPYCIVDMRDDHRREQARQALHKGPDNEDPVGIYDRERKREIPLGKILMVAGMHRDYSVKEVEVNGG